MKMYNYKIKTSFVRPEKAQSNKNGINIKIYN